MRVFQVGKMFRAFLYSIAGFGVLMKTRSARQEALFAVVGIVVFALVGATLNEFLVFDGHFLLVLSAEALNTAIEMNADKVSPERSDYARDTKDLGSFAVFCVLLVWGGCFTWVLVQNAF